MQIISVAIVVAFKYGLLFIFSCVHVMPSSVLLFYFYCSSHYLTASIAYYSVCVIASFAKIHHMVSLWYNN